MAAIVFLATSAGRQNKFYCTSGPSWWLLLSWLASYLQFYELPDASEYLTRGVDLLFIVADGNLGSRRWRMLVSESDRQDTCWQASGSAYCASEIPEAGLPWSCEFQFDSLCRSSWLLLRTVAAQEYGSTKWECCQSVARVSEWVHENYLERWLAYYVLLTFNKISGPCLYCLPGKMFRILLSNTCTERPTLTQ